jgi:hypothetical protein
MSARQPLPEGEVESATADRVRGYALSVETVTPHPLGSAESASPSGRGVAYVSLASSHDRG